MTRHSSARLFLLATIAAVMVAGQDSLMSARICLVADPATAAPQVARLRASVVHCESDTMVLSLPNGGELRLLVAPGFGDVGVIRAGDVVVVHYVEPLGLIFRAARSRAPRAAVPPEAEISFPGGEKRVVSVPVDALTGFLRTVDFQERTAVIEADAGRLFVLRVPLAVVGLDRVRFGEKVVVLCTRAVGIELEAHEPAATHQQEPLQDAGTGSAPAWSYSGATGPAQWGEMAREYALCADGRAQSPIDLKSRASRWPSPPLAFEYGEIPLDLLNDGHSIILRIVGEASLKIGKKRYQLHELRMHSPSEHTIDGKPFDMELQLMHGNDAGETAVVSILVRKGRGNPLLARFWPRLPKQPGASVRDPSVFLDLSRLLPGDRLHYAYEGSLSAPPCSEGVSWLVLAKPIECSSAQIAAFRAIYRNNARPVQPRHGRKVGLRWIR